MPLPRIIHRIWIGSVPNEEQIANLLDARDHLAGVKLWLWTTHGSTYKFPATLAGNIVVKDINTIWSFASCDFPSMHHLRSAFERERHGCFHNYAAASDIARLFILYRYGGIYLDMDVEFNDGIFDLCRELDNIGQKLAIGLVERTRNAVSCYGVVNGVLAAMPYSAAVRECLHRLTELYGSGVESNKTWHTKRDFVGRNRVALTMEISGPNMIKNLLAPFKQLLFIHEVRYFNKIDASAVSYATRPALLRHDSNP